MWVVCVVVGLVVVCVGGGLGSVVGGKGKGKGRGAVGGGQGAVVGSGWSSERRIDWRHRLQFLKFFKLRKGGLPMDDFFNLSSA